MFTLSDYLLRLLVTIAILVLVALSLPTMIENLSERLNAAVTPEVRIRR